jgi:hypothetical protein
MDKVEAVHDSIRNFEASGVELVDQKGLDSQASIGHGIPDQGQQGVKRGKGVGRPN